MNNLEILKNYVHLSNYQEPVDDLDFLGKFNFLSLPILSTICFFVVNFFSQGQLNVFEFTSSYLLLYLLSSYLLSQYYMLDILLNHKDLFNEIGINTIDKTLEEISDDVEDFFVTV